MGATSLVKVTDAGTGADWPACIGTVAAVTTRASDTGTTNRMACPSGKKVELLYLHFHHP